MRALLVVNPNATATSTRTRDVLVSALGADLRIDVERTKERGHAIELAARAAEDSYDLVIALGGDGTVNEVVNGLMSRGPRPDLPALAAVPGGSTNVFTRSLGFSPDPVEATGELLDALREGRSRRISLGHVRTAADTPGVADAPDDGETGRYFTFNAGLGLDAAVVRRVDEKRDAGSRVTSALYVRSAVQRYYVGTDRWHPAITVSGPGIDVDRKLFLALVCNTDPWTYFRGMPVRPTPDASFDTGLDLFAMTRLGTLQTLRHVAQFFARDADPRGKRVVRLHDVPEITLKADRPLPFQVDGEPLDDTDAVTMRCVPRALRVIA